MAWNRPFKNRTACVRGAFGHRNPRRPFGAVVWCRRQHSRFEGRAECASGYALVDGTPDSCADIDDCDGVTCQPQDECHVAGVCASGTGVCQAATCTDAYKDGNETDVDSDCAAGLYCISGYCDPD